MSRATNPWRSALENGWVNHMGRIAYDSNDAAAFEETRHIADHGLGAWREAVTRHLNPVPGLRLLDLGAGTGMWARAFTDWYHNIEVIAVEPSEAMRARCRHPYVLAGDAANILWTTPASTWPGCPRLSTTCRT